ncbi:MAG: DUF2802 domain-containing protein [Methylococcaceae bacterium]|nr:DUF2802 domain-containing protein [Methylococcaceae bacterium]MCI0732336.1 DUF2802 domain-containing protein [Methylococcaceae bacterium]
MNALLMVTLGVTGMLGILVIYLWREAVRLRDAMRSVQVAVNAFGNDIAGLCQAGVCQDSRISDQGRQLQKLVERIEDLGHQDQAGRSFHAAIAAARRGADVQVLTEQCGITRDAAELLVRLHGSASG